MTFTEVPERDSLGISVGLYVLVARQAEDPDATML
jgi:hypothetical protein